MGSVVGGDRVDRPVRERVAKGRDVLGGAQWWVDLEHRVVAGQQVGGQQQVVGGHLGRDVDPPGLRPPDHLDRAGRGDVGHVHPAVRVASQHHVARHDDLLCDPGPPRQAQATRQLALVAAGGGTSEVRVLGVLGDDAAEGADVLQRTAHHPRVVHAPPVVGEHPHPGSRARHQAELGELLAGQALGDGADRLHVDESGEPAEVVDALGCLSGVGDRRGVGHRQHRGEPAQSRCLRAGAHRLGVLSTRLPQVRVQVHQTGQRDEAIGIHDLRVLRLLADEDPVVDVQVRGASPEDRGTSDHQRTHDELPSPASRW
jgi:hypothetical protein